MNWGSVGDWLKSHGGEGAALVGGLLTGNIPAAVAAGVSMVASATGEADPTKVLTKLQESPETVIKLRELANQEASNIRGHIRDMAEIEAKDAQAEHSETQQTIRNGDNSQDWFVRRTRPGQSWLSLFAAIAYVFVMKSPDITILGMLLTLPLAYAGLRQFGKWADIVGQTKAASKGSSK